MSAGLTHRRVVAAGFVSVISFLVLGWSTGGHNDAVTGIVNGDIMALIAQLIGLALYLRGKG